MAGAVFGLAASLITFRGLWASAGVFPPPPPPAVASDEEENKQGEKGARLVAQDVEPYAVELDAEVPGPLTGVDAVKA